MELLDLLISVVLTVFVLVALGQLFSIKDSLRRLVQLAEQSRPTPPQPDSSTAILSDEELLAKWKESRDPAIAQLLKGKGYFIE